MFKRTLVVFSLVLYSSLVVAQGVNFVTEEEVAVVPTYVEEETFVTNNGAPVVTEIYTNTSPEVVIEETERFNVPVVVSAEAPKATNPEDVNKVAREAGQAIGEFFVGMMEAIAKELAPLMIAAKENTDLPKADYEMVMRVKQCLPEQYRSGMEYKIDTEQNSLEVFGKYNEEGSIVEYKIIRNLVFAIVINDMKNGKEYFKDMEKFADKKNSGSLTALDGTKKPMDKMQVRKINGKDFISIIDENTKDVFLTSNIGTYTGLELQAKGEKFKKMARDFVLSLDEQCVKSAVNDDGRSLEKIMAEIEETAKDPEAVKKLMENQNNIDKGLDYGNKN